MSGFVMCDGMNPSGEGGFSGMLIELPFAEWEAFCERSNSIEALASYNNKSSAGPVCVRAVSVNGLLLMTSSVTYGPIESCLTKSWRLVPEPVWPGETTNLVHDENGIANGHRVRGCHIGLLVKFQKAIYVISESVNVKCGFPNAQPISIDSARNYFDHHESNYFKSGFDFGEWEFIFGHPLISFQKNGKKSWLMYTKNDTSIKRVVISDINEMTRKLSLFHGKPLKQDAVQLDLFS